MKKSILKKIGGLFLGLAMGLGVVTGGTIQKASEARATSATLQFIKSGYDYNENVVSLSGNASSKSGSSYWGMYNSASLTTISTYTIDSTKNITVGMSARTYGTMTDAKKVMTFRVLSSDGESVLASTSLSPSNNKINSYSTTIDPIGAGTGLSVKFQLVSAEDSTDGAFVAMTSAYFTYTEGVATKNATINGSDSINVGIQWEATSITEDEDGSVVTGATYSFTASDGAVISASDTTNGKFTASNPGTVTVSATKSGYTIVDKVVTVNSIPLSISGDSIVYNGKTITLSASSNSTAVTGVTWSSSNTDVATVDSSSGVVTGVNGTTNGVNVTITAKKDGYEDATKTITVKADVETLQSIAVSGQTTTFTKGENFSFGGTVTGTYSHANGDQNSTRTISSGITYTIDNVSASTSTILDSVGNHSVVVSAGGKSAAAYTITVNAPVVEHPLNANPELSGYQTTMFIGGARETQDLVVNYSPANSDEAFLVSSSNTQVLTVSEKTAPLNGTAVYTLTAVGNGTAAITVEGTLEVYSATTDSITVDSKTFDDFSIDKTSALTKTNYLSTDEEWSREGIILTAVYNDESTDDITENADVKWTFNPTKPSLCTDNKVTVIAKYNGKQHQKTFNITITEDIIVGIELSGTFKLAYSAGEQFDFEGMIVKNIHESGYKNETSDYTIKIGDTTVESGDTVYSRYSGQKITVSYDEFTSIQDSFVLTVSDKQVMEWQNAQEGLSQKLSALPSMEIGETINVVFAAYGDNTNRSTSNKNAFLTSGADSEVGNYYFLQHTKINENEEEVKTLTSGKMPATKLSVSSSGIDFSDQDSSYYTFELTKVKDGYTIRNEYGYLNGGNSDTNLSFIEDEKVWTITKNTGDYGTFKIQNPSNSRYFSYQISTYQSTTRKISQKFGQYAGSNIPGSNGGTAYLEIFMLQEPIEGTNKASYIKDAIDTAFLNSKTQGSNGTYSVCGLLTETRYSTVWSKILSIYQNLSTQDITDLSVDEVYGNTGYTYAKVLSILLIGANKQLPTNLASAVGYPNINPLLDIDKVNSASWIIAVVAIAGLTAIGGYFFYRKRKENI